MRMIAAGPRRYKGRPASIDAVQVREMKAQGLLGASEIAKALKIGCASVYRVLEAAQ